jgi:tetratricopeptide (TPR) repeat protein
LDRASIALWDLYELRNWFKEGEEVFGETAEAFRVIRPEGGQENEKQQTFIYAMLAHCGSFKIRQGRSEEAYHILSPCVAFLRTSKNSNAAIYSLGYIGITCWELGRFAEAKENLQEARRLAQDNGKRWSEAMAAEFLGVLSHDQGEYHQARQLLNEALNIYRRVGDPSMTAHALSYLGRTLQVLGEYSEAEMLLREGLGLTREIDYRFGAGLTLDALGQIASAQGHFEEAAGFFSESADLFRDIGDTHRLSRTLNHQGLNALALCQVREARNAFKAALSMAHEVGLIPSALNALTGLAAIETSQEPGQDTLELVINILQQTSSNKEAQDLASRLRVELESKLTHEEIRVAEERAGSKSLDDLARRFLASV